MVTAIYQDSKGFIWIGTQAGLQRYDGTRFKNYLADVRDTSALQSDWIADVFEDSKKRLWVGNDNGAPYVLNRATGKFYNYNLHAAAENKINGIWNFAEDKQGNLFVAGHEGYYRLNEVTNTFEKFNAAIGLDKEARAGLLNIDADNNFWISTGTGIKFYDQQQKKMYSSKYNPYHNPIFDIKEGVGKILPGANDVWISCQKVIYRYTFSTKKLQAFSFDKVTPKKPANDEEKESIGSAFRLQDGKIMVLLLKRGFAFYQPAADNFIITNADNTKPYTYHLNESLASNACLLQDREKNILVGTNGGINIFNPDKQFFQTHLPGTEKNNLFPKEITNDFLELPNGDILISYYNVNGGIVKMDSNFHFKKQYLLKGNGNSNSLSNQVWVLFKDEKGMVWAPTQMKTMVKLNLETGRLTEDKDEALSGPFDIIQQDSERNIWMGHWSKGLVKLAAGTHQKSFYTQFLFSDSSNIKRVQCMLLEGDKIWVGTVQNGLQLFDKTRGKFVEAFVTDVNNKTAVSNNCITDIIRYNSDTLIVATLMGVNIFDTKNKTFKAITAKEGLPNNLVQAIIKDDKGNVWAACYDNGFCKINMQHFTVTKYDTKDGTTVNIFTSKFHRLKNGRILIGAAGSFVSFNPAAFSAAAPPADVYITGVHVFEKEVMIDSLLNSGKALTLTYEENALRIEFASLEYWSPGTIQYFYKLEGADKDWVTADKDLPAVYNQLKEGHYVFNIKCASRDGIFCSHTTQLKITITPPFWKTWGFIALVIFCIMVLIYTIVKWREKNIRAIAAAKLKVQQLNAEQYKSKLELEQIINYFSSSLIDKHTVDDVLWDVAKNLIGQLGFVDCMFYLWNDDKTKMLQKAGFGPKDTAEEISKQSFTVLPGQGVVGYVIQTKNPVLINDTSIDSRYRPDDITRLSEITVPIIYNDELLGVLDSEHNEKNFFTLQHLQILSTIATLVATKIKSIEAEYLLQQKHIEIYSMNDQLSKAKLDSLRSQMNPHFIFNSLNAIQECILTNKVDAAYKYLSKFSRLQRMVLNNSEKEIIPLSSEIEMLELYLSLESLRFSESFSYSINTDKITDIDDVMIPSLITQPLIENAIWHGLRSKEGEKILSVVYEEKEGLICITIDDNGIGRQKAAAIQRQKLGNSQFASRGIIILEQRLYVLSQQHKAEIYIAITDKKDAQENAAGTKVVLSFPANLENL